jgi:murein DD-endopeptidase MepM/ murein hydrolase activator NlpD
VNIVGSVTGNTVGGVFTSGTFSAPITACFGLTDDAHPTPHSGTDLGPPEGTPVPCLAAGRVVFVSVAGAPGWAATFGNSCIVDHGDGTRALYAHMRDAPLRLVGEEVAVGEALGLVGNTGYSFGAHLHLGLSTDANPWFNKDADGGVSRLLDPMEHLDAVEVPTPVPPPAPAVIPDGYSLLAHAADREARILGRMVRLAEAGAPKFVLEQERDAALAAVAALSAAVTALP